MPDLNPHLLGATPEEIRFRHMYSDTNPRTYILEYNGDQSESRERRPVQYGPFILHMFVVDAKYIPEKGITLVAMRGFTAMAEYYMRRWGWRI